MEEWVSTQVVLGAITVNDEGKIKRSSGVRRMVYAEGT
jgi:hypothetical protein